jgi:hypothetical protein
MRPGRGALIAAIASSLSLLAAAPAGALSPPTGWNGANPFNCELQYAGFGTAFPHPDADPFCVDFDKRRQNVTDLGVVDFLSQEPARVAAAVPKCFYFQSDHWRGSVVQGDPSTKTYEWDGHYFFDKATGDGGVWVTNFNVNGQTYDPSAIPGIPADYARYFGPGTGGTITHNSIPSDPRCVELARTNPRAVYGAGKPVPSCSSPNGSASTRRLGIVTVGDTERRVRDLLGAPSEVRRGFLRYCLNDRATFLVGQPGDRSGDAGGAGAGDEPTALVYTDSQAYRYLRVRPGLGTSALKRRWRHATVRLRMGKVAIYAPSRTSPVIVGVRAKRLRWIAVYDRGRIRSPSALREYLLRTTPD